MSLGKKISCPYCKTKLFTFNKSNFNCPVCKKKITVPEKIYDNSDDEETIEPDMTDEELLAAVIPQNYYEVLDMLNNLDEKENINEPTTPEDNNDDN